MNLRNALFVSLTILFAGGTSAFGTIWTVDDDGPADYASIQKAIVNSSTVNGDTIKVEPGPSIGWKRFDTRIKSQTLASLNRAGHS